jgi:hypothetical protein
MSYLDNFAANTKTNRFESFSPVNPVTVTLDPQDKALRYNQGKPKWSLVHYKSLEPMVKVLMYGADKYAVDNWKKGLDRREILDSLQRHVTALMDGQEVDPESRLHHIGHIMANCMFYSYFNIPPEE